MPSPSGQIIAKLRQGSSRWTFLGLWVTSSVGIISIVSQEMALKRSSRAQLFAWFLFLFTTTWAFSPYGAGKNTTLRILRSGARDLWLWALQIANDSTARATAAPFRFSDRAWKSLKILRLSWRRSMNTESDRVLSRWFLQKNGASTWGGVGRQAGQL